jgi:hypothetical protein
LGHFASSLAVFGHGRLGTDVVLIGGAETMSRPPIGLSAATTTVCARCLRRAPPPRSPLFLG